MRNNTLPINISVPWQYKNYLEIDLNYNLNLATALGLPTSSTALDLKFGRSAALPRDVDTAMLCKNYKIYWI